jgi:LDH2 family malate/lactate/ureidoglycolate dehydrogenase
MPSRPRSTATCTTSPPRSGVDEIRIPGQGLAARRSDRLKNGVPLSETLIKQVDELAKSLAIEALTSR